MNYIKFQRYKQILIRSLNLNKKFILEYSSTPMISEEIFASKWLRKPKIKMICIHMNICNTLIYFSISYYRLNKITRKCKVKVVRRLESFEFEIFSDVLTWNDNLTFWIGHVIWSFESELQSDALNLNYNMRFWIWIIIWSFELDT